MKDSILVTIVLILAIAIAGSALFIFSRPKPQEIQFVYKTTPSVEQLTPTPKSAEIMVDVEGAVVNPGVYTLPIESRVEEAITAAGGLKEDADPEKMSISRAAKIRDEQRIYIPFIGEAPQVPTQKNPTSSSKPNSKVNINTASREELIGLNGIGETTADKIIKRRNEKGPFNSIEQLLEEKIMTQGNFDKAKEDMMV